MRSHASLATVVEFTPSGALNRPPPPKRLGYDLAGGGRFCVEHNDVPRARALLYRAVRVTYYPDDQFAKLVAALGRCPHCGVTVEVIDGMHEQICQACSNQNREALRG